jgi:hypothetical protein
VAQFSPAGFIPATACWSSSNGLRCDQAVNQAVNQGLNQTSMPDRRINTAPVRPCDRESSFFNENILGEYFLSPLFHAGYQHEMADTPLF